MTKKQGNLTIAKIKKVSKQMDETEKYEISTGEYEGETITFYPLFDNVKIEELLTEYAALLTESDEKKIKLSQQMQVYILQFLIIKHFTHFKKDIASQLLSEGKNVGLLDMLEHFRKTGLYEECLNEMFLPQEIRKVFDKMTDIASMGLLAQDLDNQMVEKFQKLKLKNKDVFEQLGKLKVNDSE